MKKSIATVTFLLIFLCGHAQNFKLDNVNYQTISWIDFFKKLEKNPKLVYYDIRSDGERGDNSKNPALNQGKIKGAIETDFGDFKKSYPEYLKHKGDTVYLYCSHSKRSRALANQLKDSAFTKVVNINGGLSYFNMLSQSEMPYKNKYYTSNLKYRLISPKNFAQALGNEKYQIIDIRPDSVYLGISKIERSNSFGNIKSALHIPYGKLKENLNLLDKNKSIYLFDNEGEQSPIAANFLIDQGYDANVLLFGLSAIVGSATSNNRNFMRTKYQFIQPEELLKIIQRQSNTVIIDIRSEAEYKGTDKVARKNTGIIKNAVNIPWTTLSKEKIVGYSGKTIIIYDRMMYDDELFEYAKRLKGYGIKDLHVLAGGISKLKEEIYEHQKVELKILLEE